jgi:hypothetical protein
MTRGPFEVLFEFRQVGDYVKVSAVDPVTNTEVAIVGSSRMSKEALKASALRKLRYVIAKNRTGGQGEA